MAIVYLTILCGIAAANMVFLLRVNLKDCGPYPAIFFATFVTCVGHLMIAMSSNVDQVIVANKLNYVGSIFLPLFTFNAIVHVCQLKFPQIAFTLLAMFSLVVFGLSATVGFSDIYYKSIEFVEHYGMGDYVATYGIGHDFFNVMLASYVVLNISTIVYAFFKKKNVSYKSLIALSLIEVATIVAFFLTRFLASDILVMPAVYVFDQFVLLYLCVRVGRYDITRNVIHALEENNNDGYICVSSDVKFLGCNEIAEKFFPELVNCRVDHSLNMGSPFMNFLVDWVGELHSRRKIISKDFEYNGRFYKFSVKKVSITSSKYTNLFKVEDDTDLHNYVQNLGATNTHLKEVVENNFSHITAIQEQMIVGMANMVESRDSNTGGHIKRTSNVVSILVDELRRENIVDLDDDFYSNLIKSAPMHDLGKIAVDDAILRKPGRFTPEEYDVMKTHPVKGAAIVDNLLSSLESPEFVVIAKNVALSHHERFDGKGYPFGLKGAEIPLEARIMAIADVYDALVSKRCYKDRFSFEKAFDIIAEGMGTQFDPSLWNCFYNSRRRLEDYYKSLES